MIRTGFEKRRSRRTAAINADFIRRLNEDNLKRIYFDTVSKKNFLDLICNTLSKRKSVKGGLIQ